MKKISITALLFLLLIPLASSIDYCHVVPVQYYGFCNMPGDVLVYKEDGTLVARQLYSVSGGCNNGKYAITILGGQNCVLEHGDTIVFKLNAITVGADIFEAIPRSVKMDLTINRTYIIIDNDKEDIKAIDEEGIDVSSHGSSGGGSGKITLTKLTDDGNIDIAVFEADLDKDNEIDAGTEDYGVYVELPTDIAEILVPVNYNTRTVLVCSSQKTFVDCSPVKIKMGESYEGISVDADYRTVNGNRYYVVKGLSSGIVKEAPGMINNVILAVVVGLLVAVLAVYLIVKRKNEDTGHGY
jgi:hypothetical protein